MKTITILGSTGSIGTQALEVIDGLDYRVLALAAGKNTARAEEQIRKYKPKYAAMADEAAAKELALKTADTDVKILSGSAGIKEISALSADIVLNAIVGVAGLIPTSHCHRGGLRHCPCKQGDPCDRRRSRQKKERPKRVLKSIPSTANIRRFFNVSRRQAGKTSIKLS